MSDLFIGVKPVEERHRIDAGRLEDFLKKNLENFRGPLTIEQFKRGMMALSANSEYLEWLVGRRLSDHDRAPAYSRIKAILAARYAQDQKAKLRLPSPAWARGS